MACLTVDLKLFPPKVALCSVFSKVSSSLIKFGDAKRPFYLRFIVRLTLSGFYFSLVKHFGGKLFFLISTM